MGREQQTEKKHLMAHQSIEEERGQDDSRIANKSACFGFLSLLASSFASGPHPLLTFFPLS